MAVDTAQKRFSATSVFMPSMTPGVVPAGTIGQALRQAVAWFYSGILASDTASTELACVTFTEGSVAAIAFAEGSVAAIAFTEGDVAVITFEGGSCP